MISQKTGHIVLGALILVLWVNSVFFLKSWVNGFISTLLLILAVKNILYMIRR